ncbi:uncharacterized protein KQ657_000539 [Scheffersomyces spartinae]|uniref:Uncharacterized protein n=1 Tax=Scheffersomyces spartinae TaxID=45513 RepID=A0A9P7V930_9ASCO|nr:uncharacterized protein KQ657_000539 [Scheffersomyces spartinae]KAG7193472.1 hypothetical protein KQ657_000539 [Scheffersomyces spartinae]
MLDSRIVVDDKLDEKALELSNNDTRLLAEDVGMLSLELSLSKEADEFATKVSEPILEEGIYESYADESEFAEDSAAAEVKQLEYVHSLESDNSKLVDEYSISELAVEVGFDEI